VEAHPPWLFFPWKARGGQLPAGWLAVQWDEMAELIFLLAVAEGTALCPLLLLVVHFPCFCFVGWCFSDLSLSQFSSLNHWQTTPTKKANSFPLG